jgi:predicted metal-dependent phosphoesterase TrpH
MKIKADFHIHTHHSPDSGASASDIVDCARRAGLGAIGVADHNTTRGALEVRELAKGRPLVLVGQEVKTKSGEILVFGPEKDIPKKMGLEDTCKMAKSMGGFIIAPHPFVKTRLGIGNDIFSVIDYIDAIEVLNARCLSGRSNRKAEAFAAENEIPVVSGSDAHFPEEIGGCVTELEIEGKLTENSVFSAVTSGRTKISGCRSGVRPHVRTMLRRIGL